MATWRNRLWVFSKWERRGTEQCPLKDRTPSVPLLAVSQACYSKVLSLLSQSCPTLFEPLDCSLRGSLVHGVPQARVLEWVATASSKGSSPPRDGTHASCVSCIGRQILYHCTTWEARRLGDFGGIKTYCCNSGLAGHHDSDLR